MNFREPQAGYRLAEKLALTPTLSPGEREKLLPRLSQEMAPDWHWFTGREQTRNEKGTFLEPPKIALRSWADASGLGSGAEVSEWIILCIFVGRIVVRERNAGLFCGCLQVDFSKAHAVSAARRVGLDFQAIPVRGKVGGIAKPERPAIGADEL